MNLLSVIVAVSGRPLAVEPFLLRMLRVASEAPHGLQFVFVFDGLQWGTFPSVQRAAAENRRIVVDVLQKESSLPAIAMNRGAELAGGSHCAFCHHASPWSESVAGRLLAHVKGAGRSAPAYVGSEAGLRRGKFGHDPHPAILADWMLYDPVVPLCNFVVPTELFEAIGGFDTTLLLQHRFDHEFLVRLTRSVTCSFLGMHDDTNLQARPSLLGALSRSYPVADDIARRYIVRRKTLPPVRNTAAGEFCSDPTFLRDLPRASADFLIRHSKRFLEAPPAPAAGRPVGVREPLRITITGGAYEYHHNWLCFYNYLQYLQGSGFASYQSILDINVTREDLIGSDIVFLSRCRSDNVGDIVAFCNEAKIPVVYMIDDNWFSVGADWPKAYGEMFKPGSPPYDNFIYAIENCDAVLTYNRLLADDVAPHAQRVVTLPNSVDLERFESFERPTNRNFLVGYAGSPRFEDASFEALLEVGRRRSDVDVFLMGSALDALGDRFAGCRLIQVPHQPYDLYVQTLRTAGLDLLLAPLDRSHTSRSKCPNKYLEITAAGAVGIYSAVEPYIWHVEDGVSGRLVVDDTSPTAWANAIESLLDRSTLAAMRSAARADVDKSYRASSVAVAFKELVLDLVAAGSQGRRSMRSSARVVQRRTIRVPVT